MHWLYDLPLVVLCVLLVLGSVAVALAGVLLVRRLGWTLTSEDNGTAASLHAFVSVVYAVALGLLVVAIQSDYGDVEESAIAEASALDDLYRVVDSTTPAVRDRLHRQIEGYVALVVDEEWPATRHGRTSERTWRAADELARAVITLEPASPAEERAWGTMADLVDEVLDERRHRLFEGAQGVGAPTWIVVLVGGIITIGFACFFRMERLRSQLLLTGLMGAMFGLMLFLMVGMDHPLWGSMSVEPDAFRELQRDIARERAEERDRG